MYRNLAIEYEGEDRARLIGRRLTSANNAVRAAAASVAHWHKRRIATRQLMALDDRTLKDIGFFRGDIHSVADTRLKTSLGEARPISVPPRPAGTPLSEEWVLAARRQAETAARGDTLKFVI